MRTMRTTIAIADELVVAAKRHARERGQTLGQVVEAGLRRELAASGAGGDSPPVPVFHGEGGPRPGLDLTSNRALHEALDDGLELEARR